jgi:ABC-type hemin transport system substrate-binding protein
MPDLVILPSEPFAFNRQHIGAMKDLLAFTPAAKGGRILLMDGTLLTWHGTRMGEALQELPALFLA